MGGLLPVLLLPWAASEVELEPAHVQEPTTVVSPLGQSFVLSLDETLWRILPVEDALQHIPGVHIRRSGSAGSFSEISVRGLSGARVTFMVEDVALNDATLGAYDLSWLPLEMFTSVSVAPTQAPLRLAAPMGGVIKFSLSQESQGHYARLGWGSQWTRIAHASTTLKSTTWGDVSLGLHYEGSRGDFEYYNDGSTLYTRDDDRTERRINNEHDRVVFLGRHQVNLSDDVPLQTLALGRFRDQGVPGPGIVPTTGSHAREWEGFVRTGIQDLQLLDNVHTDTAVEGLVNHRKFRDPLGEVGLGVGRSTNQLYRLGWDATTRVDAHKNLRFEVAPRLAQAWYSQDINAQSTLAQGQLRDTRQQAHLGLAAHAAWERWELRAEARGLWLKDQAVGAQSQPTRAFSPRGVVGVNIGSCHLTASGGGYHRPPSLLERYGDGVLSVANASLRPERGLAADAGSRCDLSPGWGKLRLGTTAFGSNNKNLIALVQNSQTTARAQNLGKSEIRGVEAWVDTKLSMWRALATYTLTHTADRSGELGVDGNALVGVPRHRASFVVSWLWQDRLTARYTLTAQSKVALDRANLNVAPPRLLHHASLGASVGIPGLWLYGSVRNAFDLRTADVDVPGSTTQARVKIADFVGYPIPGRQFFVSLVYRN